MRFRPSRPSRVAAWALFGVPAEADGPPRTAVRFINRLSGSWARGWGACGPYLARFLTFPSGCKSTDKRAPPPPERTSEEGLKTLVTSDSST